MERGGEGGPSQQQARQQGKLSIQRPYLHLSLIFSTQFLCICILRKCKSGTAEPGTVFFGVCSRHGLVGFWVEVLGFRV